MNYGKQPVKQRAKALDAKGIKIRNKIGLWIGKIVLAAVAIVLVVAISAGIGVWKGIIDTAPDISEIDVTPTGYSTTVYDAAGNVSAIHYGLGAVTVTESRKDG